MTDSVTIVEVAPRDGLQSDPTMLDTAQKVALITRAVRAGIRRIETVSFVNPKRVPQMADAAEVMDALHADVETRALGASYIGLVLNRRGLERALDTGVDEINSVVIASDTFAQKNQGQPTGGLLEASAEIVAGAAESTLPVSVTIGASYGCPYEGEVALDRLAWVIEQVVASGPAEIALADSIGVAVPTDVSERVALAREIIGDAPIALRAHFHNTRNTGLANAAAAVDAGIRIFDSSLGGIGGCPFAPNATGNVPTEDLLYMFHRMGLRSGVDLEALAANVPWLEQTLAHPVPGYLSKAGLFPRPSGS
ncbi:MAG: hydroxymethylglutaryl-CoA lyase [Actinobacteria bacterium]|nr:hydroxymethylglutaryl-CoA lyase [Actinomycetota bacterium]